MKGARWILGRFAPPEWRDSLEGDLCEEQVRRRAAGRYAGWAWSVPAAIGLVRALRSATRAGVVNGRRARLMSGAWQDVRMSIRSLRATPGVSIVAVLVLALGIGAGTAIYSVVDAVLLRPLPFDDADRLMAVGEADKLRPRPFWSVGAAAAPNFLDWLEMQTVFASLGAHRPAVGFTVRDSGEPEDLSAIRATASLFEVLRVRPQRGQMFTAENEVDGRDHVLLISDRLWRRRFDADPDIVGKTMMFDSGAWRIIGVLPADFKYPITARRPTDIVAPYVIPARERIRDLAGRAATTTSS